MAETLRLEANLDYQATGRLAARLAAGPAVLDAGQVTHLGALAAQLLVIARADRTPSGPRITVINPSDAFAQGMDRLGLNLADLV